MISTVLKCTKKCLRILYPLLSHLQNGTKRLDGMQGTRFQFYVFGAILPVSNLKLNVSRPIRFPSDIAITEEICLSQRCTRSLHAPRFILFCLDFFELFLSILLFFLSILLWPYHHPVCNIFFFCKISILSVYSLFPSFSFLISALSSSFLSSILSPMWRRC